MEKGAERVIWVDGLRVRVRRADVKRLNLRVTREGELCATVPFGVRTEAVEEFVRRHRAWAEAATARSLDAVRRRPTFVDGETLSLWGEPVALRVREGPGFVPGACGLEENALVLRVAPDAAREERSRLVDDFLRREASERVALLAPALEARVGRGASAWRLRRMTSRWGSCNVRTARITLNLALAELDRRCLEGVMAHELCHLWVAAHDAEFYRRLEAACPNWREVRQELRAHEAALR